MNFNNSSSYLVCLAVHYHYDLQLYLLLDKKILSLNFDKTIVTTSWCGPDVRQFGSVDRTALSMYRVCCK